MDRSTESDRPWAPPSVETVPVPSCGDAADDAAIWIHPDAPERSLVLATDKRSGILVYDLAGRQRQYLPEGNFNNVDLRTPAYRCVGARRPHDRGRERTPTRRTRGVELDHASGSLRLIGRNEPVVDEPYGVCLYLDESGQPWAVLNGKDGLFVQFELHPDHSVSEARRWRTRTQPEGCVADDDTGLLYVGEENHGVWTLSADPRQPAELAVFAKVADGILSADVEGMALYRAPGETRTDLVVSSQGDSSFAVYDTTSGAHRGSFRAAGTTRSTRCPTPTASPRKTWGLASLGIELLRERAEGDQPFFLRIDGVAPRFPSIVPEPYASMYDPESIPPWPNFDETFDGKPAATSISRNPARCTTRFSASRCWRTFPVSSIGKCPNLFA